MANLQALKAELLAGHPDTGAYNVDDAIAADEINALNRDAPADSIALLRYLTLERFRQGTLYGRLQLVACNRPVKDGNSWSIPELPLGANDADVAITQENIAAAATLLRFVDTDTADSVNLLDSRLDAILDSVGPTPGGCDAIGAADKTALQGLSQNQQSRAMELGLGVVRPGTVQMARALP